MAKITWFTIQYILCFIVRVMIVNGIALRECEIAGYLTCQAIDTTTMQHFHNFFEACIVKDCTTNSISGLDDNIAGSQCSHLMQLSMYMYTLTVH